MTFLRAAFVALALALAAPAAAAAADRFVVRDEPVGSASTALGVSAAQPAPERFNLVGLHWKGSGTIWFRTLSAAGRWSDWHAAAPEDEDLPDVSSTEASGGRGWR